MHTVFLFAFCEEAGHFYTKYQPHGSTSPNDKYINL